MSSTKAIPLRRSRAAARVAAVETARLTSGLLTGIAPARALWLAGLGGTSFAVRGAAALWTALVAEGAAVERWLASIVPGAPWRS